MLIRFVNEDTGQCEGFDCSPRQVGEMLGGYFERAESIMIAAVNHAREATRVGGALSGTTIEALLVALDAAGALEAGELERLTARAKEEATAVERLPELYKCAGASCPGLPWRASDRAHPESCVDPASPAVDTPPEPAPNVEALRVRVRELRARFASYAGGFVPISPPGALLLELREAEQALAAALSAEHEARRAPPAERRDAPEDDRVDTLRGILAVPGAELVLDSAERAALSWAIKELEAHR